MNQLVKGLANTFSKDEQRGAATLTKTVSVLPMIKIQACQKVQTSSYKVNQSWGCNVQHGD